MIGCTYPDCGKLIENRDKNLCATHNKQFRGVVKPKKLYPLKPKKQKPIAKHSETNTWEGSDGTRYTSVEVAKNIHDAKARKKGKMMAEHGYFFCEQCKRHHDEEGSPLYLDFAHIISTDQCKKKGIVELSWDEDNNLKLLCRKDHAKYDRNDVQWTVNNK